MMPAGHMRHRCPRRPCGQAEAGVPRSFIGAIGGALFLAAGAAFAQSVPLDDPRFRAAYLRLYEALDGVAADLVVMELRDRIELIAAAGSHVGAASNQRRVRGFESGLLQRLQTAVCRGAPAGQGRPSPAVVDAVGGAARAQNLRTEPPDLAELSAMAQRLLDSQPRGRWCSLGSFDDLR